jgi:hypothetical protein
MFVFVSKEAKHLALAAIGCLSIYTYTNAKFRGTVTYFKKEISITVSTLTR